MRKFFFNNQKGFALLYAILLTGAVLTIGVLLMNIVTKQLIYSTIGKNSETAYYYVANSIKECIDYRDYTEDKFSSWAIDGSVGPVADVQFDCLGELFDFPDPGSPVSPSIYLYQLSKSITIDGNPYMVDIKVYKNYDCVLGSGSYCDSSGTYLYDKNSTVAIVFGYSQAGPRGVKRAAVFARPL